MNAVLIYFGLVFLVSWGGGSLVLGPSSLPLSADELTGVGPLAFLVLIGGPSVSGILMLAVTEGMPGMREFLARLSRWRVGPRWYALALVPALSMTGATLVLSLTLGWRPAILAAENGTDILAGAIGSSVMIGLLEEIGWTGFAAPHLRARYSILSTGFIIGVVWGLWHFPLFWEADSLHAALPFSILLARLFAWLPPFRVLLVWIHERTGSLPLVMLMHASVTFASMVFAPVGLSGIRLLMVPLAAAATMWTLLAVVGMGRQGSIIDAPPEPRVA